LAGRSLHHRPALNERGGDGVAAAGGHQGGDGVVQGEGTPAVVLFVEVDVEARHAIGEAPVVGVGGGQALEVVGAGDGRHGDVDADEGEAGVGCLDHEAGGFGVVVHVRVADAERGVGLAGGQTRP